MLNMPPHTITNMHTYTQSSCGEELILIVLLLWIFIFKFEWKICNGEIAITIAIITVLQPSSTICSDVNKDLTFKDKDKDQTFKAKDQDKD